MKIPKKDLKIETMRGQGPGGQHRNKTDSACKITHLPTNISAYADERSQHASRRKAMKELEKRLIEAKQEEQAQQKKARRDHAIKNTKTIRTYDYKSKRVYDHRSGKSASLKDILKKGKIDLLK